MGSKSAPLLWSCHLFQVFSEAGTRKNIFSKEKQLCIQIFHIYISECKHFYISFIFVPLLSYTKNPSSNDISIITYLHTIVSK